MDELFTASLKVPADDAVPTSSATAIINNREVLIAAGDDQAITFVA